MRHTGRYSGCVGTQLKKSWGAYYVGEARRSSHTLRIKDWSESCPTVTYLRSSIVHRRRMAILPIADVPNLLHLPYACKVDSVSSKPSNLLLALTL